MIFDFYKQNLFRLNDKKGSVLVMGLGKYKGAVNVFKALVLESESKLFDKYIGEVMLLDMSYFEMLTHENQI